MQWSALKKKSAARKHVEEEEGEGEAVQQMLGLRPEGRRWLGSTVLAVRTVCSFFFSKLWEEGSPPMEGV